MEAVVQKNYHLHNWFSDDARFHHLFPLHIQKRARRHWTPLEVVRCASEFLVPQSGARILDIGSGVGTFCLSAAYYKPNGLFHGIEQRKDLTDYALQAKRELGLANVFFTHGNFTQLDLSTYDHFYFFNSFYENLEGTEKIDHTIEYSSSLYN
jgi:tRNA G46 methylase TrmB